MGTITRNEKGGRTRLPSVGSRLSCWDAGRLGDDRYFFSCVYISVLVCLKASGEDSRRMGPLYT